MGEQTRADVVSMRLADGDKLTIEGLALEAIYTPGHTDDSYSFILPDRVFTGDTLLIRGTGRTDFQNGDPRQQYDSIFNRLLKLPDATLVYPAHDYKGDTVSTIGEEKAYNPRLQVKSVQEYVELMNNLNLANPKMMDVVVPANMKVGLAQENIALRGWSVSATEALALLGKANVALIDLRERSERERHGIIPARCTCPIWRCRKASAPAACSANLPNRPASVSYSTAPLANVRPWPYRPLRTPVCLRPAICRGASDAWKKLNWHRSQSFSRNSKMII